MATTLAQTSGQAQEATTGGSTSRLGPVLLVVGPTAYLIAQLLWPSGSNGSDAAGFAASHDHPTTFYLAALLEAVSGWATAAGAFATAAHWWGRGRTFFRIAATMTLASSVFFTVNWVMNTVQIILATSSHPAAGRSTLHEVTGSGYLVPMVAFVFVGALGGLLLSVAAARGRVVRWWVPALAVLGAVTVQLTESQDGLVPALANVPTVLAGVLLARGVLATRR